MKHSPLIRTAFAGAALCSLLGATRAQSQVWIVDDDPGAGVDFETIQQAVFAAADGDLILVRAGEYLQFTIDDKALSIVGDEGALVSSSVQASATPIHVRNLSAPKTVTIRNLEVDSPALAYEQPAIAVVSCAGSVLFEGCEVETPLGHGAIVTNSGPVTFVRCSIRATSAGVSPFPSGTGTWLPREGLHAVDSEVYLFETECYGSFGEDALDQFFIEMAPGDGGTGVRLTGGSLFASRSNLAGGAGGSDAVGTVCFPAGDGGFGLALHAGESIPVARVLDSLVYGGSAGISDCIDPDGVAGTGTTVEAGTLEELAGVGRTFEWSASAEAGQTFQARYTGEVGDFFWVLIGLGLGSGEYLDGYASALLLPPSFLVVALGTLPPGGEVTQEYTALDIGFLSHLPLVGQAAFLDSSLGFWVSGPSALELLAPGTLP